MFCVSLEASCPPHFDPPSPSQLHPELLIFKSFPATNIFLASLSSPCIHGLISLLSVVNWWMDPSYILKSSLMSLI